MPQAMECIVILMILGMPRPPEPNVPVPYDRSETIDAPVLDWRVIEPNETLIYAVGVWNMGWDITFHAEVVEADGINLQYIGEALDPGGGKNRYWQVSWQPPTGAGGIYYLRLIARETVPLSTGEIRERSDKRTVIIYVLDEHWPVIFPVTGPYPVSTMRQRQQWWQYAKKRMGSARPVNF